MILNKHSARTHSRKHCCSYRLHIGPGRVDLPHWGRDKMIIVFQTIFWNAVSWMKNLIFCFKFHCDSFVGDKFTISQHWLKGWLSTKQATVDKFSPNYMVGLKPIHNSKRGPSWFSYSFRSDLHACWDLYLYISCWKQCRLCRLDCSLYGP